MLLGVLVNAAILLGYFWNILCVDKKDIVTVSIVPDELEVESRVMNLHRFSPATMAHRTLVMSQDIDVALGSISVASIGDISLNSRQNETEIEPSAPELKGSSNIPDAICAGELVVLVSSSSSRQTDVAIEGKEVQCGKWKKYSWKVSVYLVTLGMLIALLMGLNLSWTAITAALVLVVIDFRDAQPCLEKVSYPLLIFFCGMFITVDGFNKTGLPSALWDLVEPYAKINSASGVALLSMVVLVLSNIASNVPTVLLLGSRVASSASKISPEEVTKAWLILAFVSTIAGNLSLLGSAANLIVCEQARRVQFSGYNLSFFSHLRFGVPSTLVVTTMGLLLIYVS